MILSILQAIAFTLLCLFGFFLCFVFFLVLRCKWIRWMSNLSFVPLESPYIYGNISHEKHRSLQLADFYQRYRTQPLIGINMLLEPSVMIIDLELIRRVLIKDFQHFQDRGMFYTERDPLSGILGTLDHAKWKPLRSKLTPAFTPTKIKDMFETMKTVGDALVRGLNEIVETEDQVEIRELFSRFTTDVIGEVAIGIHCKTLDESTQLREKTKEAMQPHLKFPWNHFTTAYPRLARFLSKFWYIPLFNFRKHPKDVSDFFINVVEQTIQYREKNNVRGNDYMQLLIDAGLKINEIAALAFDFLSAGYADSTSTLAYCLYELALPGNWHIQDKARKEIQSILEQNNGQLTNEVLTQMVYCKKIINETLRKHPVAGNLTRIATKSYQVYNTNILIPKGMRVFIPIYAIHHDAAFYPDPEKFNPERKEPPSSASISFGAGQRQCIGYRFATLLVTVALVSLLQKFKFSTCNRTQIPIKYSADKNTLIPSLDGVWLKVNRI